MTAAVEYGSAAGATVPDAVMCRGSLEYEACVGELRSMLEPGFREAAASVLPRYRPYCKVLDFHQAFDAEAYAQRHR